MFPYKILLFQCSLNKHQIHFPWQGRTGAISLFPKEKTNTRHSFNNCTEWECTGKNQLQLTGDSNSKASKCAQLAVGGATFIPYFQVPEEPRFTEAGPFAAPFHQQLQQISLKEGSMGLFKIMSLPNRKRMICNCLRMEKLRVTKEKQASFRAQSQWPTFILRWRVSRKDKTLNLSHNLCLFTHSPVHSLNKYSEASYTLCAKSYAKSRGFMSLSCFLPSASFPLLFKLKSKFLVMANKVLQAPCLLVWSHLPLVHYPESLEVFSLLPDNHACSWSLLLSQHATLCPDSLSITSNFTFSERLFSLMSFPYRFFVVSLAV